MKSQDDPDGLDMEKTNKLKILNSRKASIV